MDGWKHRYLDQKYRQNPVIWTKKYRQNPLFWYFELQKPVILVLLSSKTPLFGAVTTKTRYLEQLRPNPVFGTVRHPVFGTVRHRYLVLSGTLYFVPPITFRHPLLCATHHFPAPRFCTFRGLSGTPILYFSVISGSQNHQF